MTTAVNEKPAQAPAPSKPAPIIMQERVPLHKIEVLGQVRKKFDANAHKELVESIRTKDVINPITLRPSPRKAGMYLLVAGERRFRAAREAGLHDIPATVRELDDQAAALYQVEENIHRKDLTPIEEARGFKLLLDAKKFTVEQLAQLVDKSKVYVYRAVSLLEVPKLALDKIESGEWTPAHGHQVLRVPADKREQLVKDWLNDQYEGDTAKAFADWIDHQVGKTLSNADFPKDRPYAEKPACSSCPLNTGNQGTLFDGAVKGKCTGPECFEAKEKFYAKEKLEEAKATAQKLGFQWLGESTAQGYGDDKTFKGHKILSPAEAKKAKDPKKYAAGWVTHKYRYSSDDKDSLVIVRLKTEAEKKAEEKQRASRSADPKDEFIAEEVDKEFGREIARLARRNPLEAARSIAAHELDNTYSMNESALEILGLKSKAEIEKRVKVSKSVEELLAITLVVRAADNGEYEFTAGDIGADMKAVRKSATAAAEKAWAALQTKNLVDKTLAKLPAKKGAR
jgi:ParB/RepB/Spo0J family partition protein